MRQQPNDTDAERLVQRSAAFRLVRGVLLALDAAAASSTLAREIAPRVSFQSLGISLLAASITHAVLVTLVPASAAPAGRYLFAVGGALAGALLLAASRSVRASGTARNDGEERWGP